MKFRVILRNFASRNFAKFREIISKFLEIKKWKFRKISFREILVATLIYISWKQYFRRKMYILYTLFFWLDLVFKSDFDWDPIPNKFRFWP